MQKSIVAIAAILSLTLPGASVAQPKTPSKPKTQTLANQGADRSYLKMLNYALTQGAPDYLSVSDEEKLNYGHYTCQALDAKVSLDTVLFDYLQKLTKEVSPELHQQAGFFFGSSMYAGVYNFCPNHLPQLNDWGKKRFVQQ